MLNTRSFLAVDFGAGSLKLAEFETNEAGGLRLKTFSIKPLGAEGSQEATREKIILKALQEALAEKGIKARDVNVCAPGFHVFSKFVKLPPVDANKVTQIIQYEAQQNVPFPLSEVVWDYQILGSAPSGELEVLLVAVKSDVVEGLFRIAAEAKLRLNLCDASPAALCNAFRYNYGDLEDCTMLLDIGAKTSNLLFFEKGKVFSRSINLGANAITQDFANESKMKFEVAEQIKVVEGFVSLGGAYAEPENANQAAVAKIARQFMTKLHIQVNQTMQFYRGQQNGSAPQRVFLAGGASIMPYTAQFFAEKLQVPVEYFNPFRNVEIDPTVSLEELAQVAHSLGEVVGLGLRNLANCPVEMNLMPESTVRWRTFNEKKPYFLATVFLLALVAGAIGFLFQKLAVAKLKESSNLEPKVREIQNKVRSFQQAYGNLQNAQTEADQITTLMEDRYYWGNLLAELRHALIRSENDIVKKYAAAYAQKYPGQTQGMEAGIWVEQMTTANPGATAAGGYYNNPNIPNPNIQNPNIPNPNIPNPNVASTTATDQTTNAITLVCRAVDLSSVDSSANQEVVYAVERELKAAPLFDPNTVQPPAQISQVDADNNTFTFTITVAPKNPLK
ncbi:MAG TPA: type IV pilus assembly protein PilM [Verrucomicrobiae bacterium]|nr:type IV pilus assembly protein PilM [Verrucomicrobiae bacterium]